MSFSKLTDIQRESIAGLAKEVIDNTQETNYNKLCELANTYFEQGLQQSDEENTPINIGIYISDGTVTSVVTDDPEDIANIYIFNELDTTIPDGTSIATFEDVKYAVTEIIPTEDIAFTEYVKILTETTTVEV